MEQFIKPKKKYSWRFYRIFVKKEKVKVDRSVKSILIEEKKFGITNFKTYQNFVKNL